MRDRVLRHIEALRDEPRPHGAEKLADEQNLWKVWVSRSYRVLYSIDDQQHLVTIAAAGPHDVCRRS
jgi:mRNA-degrading endonuclease RelE of RelBE toxin-antitoxin system